ncbi:MAG: hypothetical protein Q9218_004845, partial [Villophora microphyllina]
YEIYKKGPIEPSYKRDNDDSEAEIDLYAMHKKGPAETLPTEDGEESEEELDMVCTSLLPFLVRRLIRGKYEIFKNGRREPSEKDFGEESEEEIDMYEVMMGRGVGSHDNDQAAMTAKQAASVKSHARSRSPD